MALRAEFWKVLPDYFFFQINQEQGRKLPIGSKQQTNKKRARQTNRQTDSKTDTKIMTKTLTNLETAQMKIVNANCKCKRCAKTLNIFYILYLQKALLLSQNVIQVTPATDQLTE